MEPYNQLNTSTYSVHRQQLRAAILQYECYSFEYLALQVFYFQANYNAVYRSYISHLGIDPSKITQLEQIPYLPIGFFKTQTVDSYQDTAHSIVFESSGTTGTINSQHRLYDQELYKIISEKTFEANYGPLKEYHILALLPSYLERNNSSLVYMVKHFIEQSDAPLSGFYLHDTETLRQQLTLCLQDTTRKTLLIGVTFALLDLAESDVTFLQNRPHKESLIIMETGGMKGRRKEMIREEVHQLLSTAFGVKSIHSEYGMTELISQGYSSGGGIFKPGPTMKITLRDINDPLTGYFDYASYKGTGGINVIDLGNLDSCSFIETQDLGRFTATKGEFEVIGRFDNSDIRGCNLMVL